MNKGFTLIEVLIAIAIMAVGVVGIYALVPKITSDIAVNNNRFIASQLAKEGMEIVRNIRDSNWLAGNNFDNGLTDGDWLVQYDEQVILSYVDQFLQINVDGFYNYGNGETSRFKRKIVLSHPAEHILNIKIQISWSGKGSPFEIQENLYDWLIR